jgi:hypothetical protein
LKVEDCQPPTLWRQWQYLSFQSKEYEQNLESLLWELKGQVVLPRRSKPLEPQPVAQSNQPTSESDLVSPSLPADQILLASTMFEQKEPLKSTTSPQQITQQPSISEKSQQPSVRTLLKLRRTSIPLKSIIDQVSEITKSLLKSGQNKIGKIPKWAWSYICIAAFLFLYIILLPSEGQTIAESIDSGWRNYFRVSDLNYGSGSWAVIMSVDSPYGRQAWYSLSDFPGDYIETKWGEGFRITNLAYGRGKWIVVMSQDNPYGRQTWQTLPEFPEEYISTKWAEGFRVTSLAYGDDIWAIVMSQQSLYGRQTWQTFSDFPSDYIEAKWTEGFRVTT